MRYHRLVRKRKKFICVIALKINRTEAIWMIKNMQCICIAKITNNQNLTPINLFSTFSALYFVRFTPMPKGFCSCLLKI